MAPAPAQGGRIGIRVVRDDGGDGETEQQTQPEQGCGRQLLAALRDGDGCERGGLSLSLGGGDVDC